MQAATETVISVGADRELLWLRDSVLRSAGFNVISTDDAEDALARIKRGECGVLVFCYSFPRPTRMQLSDALRKCCPGSRIVAIAHEQLDKPDFADTFVYGVEGPEALIDAIRGPAS